jgi:transposase
MEYIGIDISKDYFDADLSVSGVRRFANTPNGYKQFINVLAPKVHCVMESTGPYGYKLAMALYEHHIAISMVNPLQVKRFSQSLMRRAKTDTADALLLTCFGAAYVLRLWEPAPVYVAQLKDLRQYQEMLTTMETMLSNRQHAVSHMPTHDTLVTKKSNALLRMIASQIAAIEQRMEEIACKECAALYDCIVSINGIGAKAATALIAGTNGFATFTSAKQLASYIGVCPLITQSGTSNPGKARISKMGHPGLRKILYLCSWSAIKYNRACRELYLRLCAKGKPKMVALIAVVNKLLHQIMAVVRKQELYRDDFQSIPKIALA